MSYFSNLRIGKLIIHEIYKRDEEGRIVTPYYSQEVVKLEWQALQTIQNRIINAMGNDSHSIEMRVEQVTENSTFNYGRMLLHNQDNFIDFSKKVALNLAESQTSRSVPGGMVIVFSGTTGANDYKIWGIIKAEGQEGFSKEVSEEKISLKFITDLFLTPLQRLYKIGFFIELGSSDEDITAELLKEDFKVFVYDHNMTKNETQHAAYYFYRDFLGCSYSPTNKKMTLDFYNLAKDFIHSTPNLDQEQKSDQLNALTTYLKVSQEEVIHIEDFAKQYLPSPELQQEFVDHMESNNFPNRAIQKDLTYIKNKLKYRKTTFSNDVKIIGPADKFEELIQISEDKDNDETTVKIKGIVLRQELS